MSNSEVANRVNAEIVTKAETDTIGELLSYMKQEDAKVWFLFLESLHCDMESYRLSFLLQNVGRLYI